MTECIEEGLLQAYIDNELPPAERERVQSHVSGCPSCTTRKDELRATSTHVASLLTAYTGAPNAHTALVSAMQAADIAPRPAVRVSADVPIAVPATMAARGSVPRGRWALAMVGFSVAAVILLAFWLSGMFQAASPRDDSVLLGDVPPDPVSRPAGSETPIPAGQALTAFVPEGKVRHLVFEVTTEGVTQQKKTEEVWLVNGPEHPLLYQAVSPYGEWQLVGSDAVWTYLGPERARSAIFRLTGSVSGNLDVIFKTTYDPLHFDRYVASERSIGDILNMPGASMAVSMSGDRPATMLEYTRTSHSSIVPRAGRTPIVGFASLSTDGDSLWGWQQLINAYDPETNSPFRVAPTTPEVIQVAVEPTPVATRPVRNADLPSDGGWMVTEPETVKCRIWLDKDTYQFLQQTTTRRLSGLKRGDNGTPVPVQQTTVETRKLIVDELLEPSEVPADMFEPKVPEGYQVIELDHTFTRVLPARPTPSFLPTVTPIPYMGGSADPSPPSETVVPAVTSDVPLVMNPPGVPFGDTGWYLFTPPVGQFQVLFPRAVVDVGGRNGTTEFGVKDGGLTYMVTIRPVTTLRPDTDLEAWLDYELPRIAADLNGTLRDHRPLPATKGVARELTIERFDRRFTLARVYLAGSQLYNVFAIAVDESALSGEEVIRYLDSFELLNP